MIRAHFYRTPCALAVILACAALAPALIKAREGARGDGGDAPDPTPPGATPDRPDMRRLMRPQPEWLPGEEPDALSDIRGGFNDGLGHSHFLPVLLAGRGPVQGEKNAEGVWYWIAPDADAAVPNADSMPAADSMPEGLSPAEWPGAGSAPMCPAECQAATCPAVATCPATCPATIVPPGMPDLVPGRIVYYTPAAYTFGPEARAEPITGIIQRVFDKDAGMVNIRIFPDALANVPAGPDNENLTSIVFDATGKPSTWRYCRDSDNEKAASYQSLVRDMIEADAAGQDTTGAAAETFSFAA